MTARFRRQINAVWLLAAVSVVVMATPPTATHANGQAGAFVQQVAGPYEIALGTIPGTPIVGNLHLTMTLTELSPESPVLDADVTVTGRGPEGETDEIGPLAATNSPTSPNFYDVNTSVDRIGMWTFTVSVEAGAGDATAEFAIQVRTPNPFFRALTWITVVMFLAAISLGLYPLIRQRRRGRRRTKLN